MSKIDDIVKARGELYGHPGKNFEMIADLWSTYLGFPLNLLDVGFMMILLKVARAKQGGTVTPDTLDDISGYAECLRIIKDFPPSE